MPGGRGLAQPATAESGPAGLGWGSSTRILGAQSIPRLGVKLEGQHVACTVFRPHLAFSRGVEIRVLLAESCFIGLTGPKIALITDVTVTELFFDFCVLANHSHSY